ncbi:hypothetical protein BO82DRAFT_355028 [Aspergillus uvarum CBS 121591]|uniref:Transcription factor domain-containing protein n=1 Tax=Aspergillus uvarum CBS 121591 TaxID=1448315 RepID=A0A319CQJ0_9EURO|nr:hypothetical protein BO82DRAFT_355028 [Aspergillus uvarum CBS 121591]PYH81053.1 hypothetical protein BO82DRAFT_355028 [Aspergillus uvarum CBS 121591]
MPNIIDSPRIRLEPVLYVLYYAILYIGCTFSANNGTAEPNFELAGSCYLACLRVLPVWQPQADGSALDFVAALFMVRIAMLCCDHDLAWLMHRNACAYAQRFNLHNLDSGDQTGLQHDASCDEGRRGFWQMIQIDLHVRLILDKPATITAGAWNVNLPWLSARSRPPPGDVKATAFLITSQMAMILLQFFTFFDNAVAGGQEDLRQRTKRLCQEIQHIFANWQVDEWFAAPSDRKVDNCYKSDVLLAGYTYIIFMLRKVEGLEHEPTEVSQAGSVSLIVRDASRRIVELLNHMLKLYPNPQGLLCVLGYYKPELAVGLLYSQVIDTPDTLESRADAERLRELGGSIRDIITRRQDLTPLARAIEALDGALPKESLSSE